MTGHPEHVVFHLQQMLQKYLSLFDDGLLMHQMTVGNHLIEPDSIHGCWGAKAMLPCTLVCPSTIAGSPRTAASSELLPAEKHYHPSGHLVQVESRCHPIVRLFPSSLMKLFRMLPSF